MARGQDQRKLIQKVHWEQSMRRLLQLGAAAWWPAKSLAQKQMWINLSRERSTHTRMLWLALETPDRILKVSSSC